MRTSVRAALLSPLVLWAVFCLPCIPISKLYFGGEWQLLITVFAGIGLAVSYLVAWIVGSVIIVALTRLGYDSLRFYVVTGSVIGAIGGVVIVETFLRDIFLPERLIVDATALVLLAIATALALRTYKKMKDLPNQSIEATS
jgi:hypothetical protein